MSKVSIIVVNWNTSSLLTKCLQSIRDCDEYQGDLEIIVIDNGSTDDSVKIVREYFPEVLLVENHRNLGFGAANNIGLKKSTAPYILFLNSDAEINETAIELLLVQLDRNPRIGCVGPTLINPNGSFQASYAKFPTLITELLLVLGWGKYLLGPYFPSPKPRKGEKPHPADWIAGAAMMFRADIVKTLDGFDEEFFLYSEEVDLCHRVWDFGAEVWYVPDARVVHYGGGSTKHLSDMGYRYLYQSKVKYIEKHHGKGQAIIFRVFLRVFCTIRMHIWKILRIMTTNISKINNYQNRISREFTLLNYLKSKNNDR